MTIIISKNGGPVSTSRNLRGVLTYARKYGVTSWQASMTDQYGAFITAHFGDGAESHFEFASWDVAQRWVRARHSWGLTARIVRPTHECFEARP